MMIFRNIAVLIMEKTEKKYMNTERNPSQITFNLPG